MTDPNSNWFTQEKWLHLITEKSGARSYFGHGWIWELCHVSRSAFLLSVCWLLLPDTGSLSDAFCSLLQHDCANSLHQLAFSTNWKSCSASASAQKSGSFDWLWVSHMPIPWPIIVSVPTGLGLVPIIPLWSSGVGLASLKPCQSCKQLWVPQKDDTSQSNSPKQQYLVHAGSTPCNQLRASLWISKNTLKF